MSSSVNRIRNATLDRGATAPTHWEWQVSDRRAVELQRSRTEGAVLSAARSIERAMLVQTVRAKADTAYRAEAIVSGELIGDSAESGCVLQVEALTARGVAATWRTTPVRRSTHPTTIRTYFVTPAETSTLRLSIGLCDASGQLRVHSVFLCHTLEHEAASHPLAIPPPTLSAPAPLVARTVAVVAADAADRPITTLLRTVYGPEAVRAIDPANFNPERPGSDAVLLPEASPPRGIRKLADLFALADRCVVVVSLESLAALSGAKLRVRRVEQPDDPIHARVDYAHFATRGFALHDAFAFAWPGKVPHAQRMNYLRKTTDAKAFLKKHNFVTVLSSVCDTDASSGHPVALFREGHRGGLFACDIAPAETPPTTMGEPALAVHLLLSMLGREMPALGQYAQPVATEARLRDAIREMPVRFRELQAVEADVPVDELHDQLLLLGHEDQSFGLPARARPVVFVRSGLAPGDAESVYGAWWWFKQLVRMPPHRCTYVDTLASQFRVAWQPLVAAWESQSGFRRSRRPVEVPLPGTLADREFALLVDVAVGPAGPRVVVPSLEGSYQRYAAWLPRLAEAMPPGRYVNYSRIADGADRDVYQLGELATKVEVIADPGAFLSDAHRAARERGAELVRIETPACDADFAARSIWSTDLTATMLEHVVGLAYGMIAVNRSSSAVNLPPFPPVGPGEALIVPRSDRALQAVRMQAG